MANTTTLFLKIPRNVEVTPEAAQTFLAALTQINSVSGWDKLRGVRPQPLALEIIVFNQQIRFQITTDTELVPFIEAQLQSNYPLVIMEQVTDPLEGQQMEVLPITLARGNYYPILTYPSFQDVDPLNSILNVLSKAAPNEVTIIQYALESISGSWQSHGQRLCETGGGKTEEGNYIKHPDESIIKDKISFPGFAVSLRFASNTKKTLNELRSSFGVFTRADGNYFTTKRSGLLGRPDNSRDVIERRVTDGQVLNISEIATLWHLPSEKIKISSIAWGHSVLSEAPDNLPVAEILSETDQYQATFYAHTLYKNRDMVFGIKNEDRRRHIWVVGKTGTGKSTLIANMVIEDIQKGKGVAVIDPHGDLVETILDYIPSYRAQDTIYFNPADKEYPITLNPMEVRNREEAELVVSGILSVFTKIWANVWSARMEYIMRNSLMTLAEHDGTTLGDILMLLVNKRYRDNLVNKLSDPNLQQFWRDEYDKMPDRLQKEAISPIQNKVGQFVTSPLVRRIIGNPKSSIFLEDIMNEGRIFLANLSVGRLGEDNSALLGAMLITKIQLGAMHRVDMPEDQRRDFYLYVDEFQNFATTSFIKILSEARKYRLNLMLANQYMAQIPVEIQDAILGNVGSLIAFSLGAADAEIVHKEFSEVFSQSDLVNLARHQVAVKQMIDGRPSRPFLAHTLPLPAIKHELKDYIVQNSRQNWGVKFEPYKAQEIPLIPQNNPQQPAERPERSYADRGSQESHKRYGSDAHQGEDGNNRRRSRSRGRGKGGDNKQQPHHHDTWKNPKYYGENANPPRQQHHQAEQPKQEQAQPQPEHVEEKKPVEIYSSPKKPE